MEYHLMYDILCREIMQDPQLISIPEASNTISSAPMDPLKSFVLILIDLFKIILFIILSIIETLLYE